MGVIVIDIHRFLNGSTLSTPTREQRGERNLSPSWKKSGRRLPGAGMRTNACVSFRRGKHSSALRLKVKPRRATSGPTNRYVQGLDSPGPVAPVRTGFSATWLAVGGEECPSGNRIFALIFLRSMSAATPTVDH